MHTLVSASEDPADWLIPEYESQMSHGTGIDEAVTIGCPFVAGEVTCWCGRSLVLGPGTSAVALENPKNEICIVE